MKRFRILFLSALVLHTICGFSVEKGKSLKNPFFVFNNSMNKQGMAFIPYKEQAKMLKELGYNGIEHRETTGIFDLLNEFQQQGLKVYTDYLQINIDQKEPYLPDWKQVIPKLKGTNMILWVHIHSDKYKPSDEAGDKEIIPVIQELADLAGQYGIRIAIYHHVGFLVQKVEDSYRIAMKANRKNVGSVFNLCHFLKTDSEENLEKVINLTFPKLFAVSICGADRGDTQKMEWDRLIQPLGKGSYDTYKLVKMLVDKGYQGPIGIQCYNLKGDPETYLKPSSEALKDFKQRYALSGR